MNYEEAKNLITNVLSNQKLTIVEHTQVQQAWKAITTLAEKANANGDDAVPIQRTVQPSQ